MAQVLKGIDGVVDADVSYRKKAAFVKATATLCHTNKVTMIDQVLKKKGYGCKLVEIKAYTEKPGTRPSTIQRWKVPVKLRIPPIAPLRVLPGHHPHNPVHLQHRIFVPPIGHAQPKALPSTQPSR